MASVSALARERCILRGPAALAGLGCSGFYLGGVGFDLSGDAGGEGGRRGMLTTRRWARLRKRVIARDGGCCRMCGVQIYAGRRGPDAAMVDHIRPRALRPDLAWDEDNCQTTCAACHNGACASIEARHDDDADAIAAEKARGCGFDVAGRPIW